MLLSVEQVIAALESGDPVPPRAARLVVAALRHAYAELSVGVEKALGEAFVDDAVLMRLGGYLYEREQILSDPVSMYAPAANALPAWLAGRRAGHEKFSETAS